MIVFKNPFRVNDWLAFIPHSNLFFMSQRFNLFSMFYRTASRVGRLGVCFLLGFGITLFVLTNQVHAADTVLLQYRDIQARVPLAELRAFATGQTVSPALQEILEDSQQNPTDVQEWLITEIPAPNLAGLISSEFTLLQVNKTIGDPLRRENLEPLKVALAHTLEDDQAFSILEILENYPASEVRLEINRLGQGFADVNLLVTRIAPLLSVSERLLPELVCECNLAPINALGSTEAAIAYNQTRDAAKALLSSVPQEAIAPKAEPLEIAQLTSDAPDLANKTLVFRFGPFGRSISMRNLTAFAETGNLSRGWRFFFNIAGVNPEDVRSGLNQSIAVELKFLDRNLNNLLGEFLLYQVGQVVHPRSNVANIPALRSTAILSVADDGRLSPLEFLQRYPNREVYIDGARLARLGRDARRFQASGGVRQTVVSLEDWLVQLQASAAADICQCDGQPVATDATIPASQMTAPTISPERMAEFLPANWQPVASHREDRGIVKVVWLQGTPYEMGYQHGQYLHDEIASLGSELIGVLRFAGRGMALSRLSARRSFPDVVEECRGLSDATQDIGMTMDGCLVLAFGDVYQEVFAHTLPNFLFWNGCSQWVATGEATVDGRLYHGSTLDNSNEPIDFILNNPVVFVRQPNDGLPHVSIAYPGVTWPNWGLNVAGISLGLDSAHPYSTNELLLEGGSDVQILAKVLKTATTFAEAREIMETQPRVRANLIMIADAKTKEAGVFEVTGPHLGVRELQENGVLYVSNHFVLEEMFNFQSLPVSQSSINRFNRFAQLMEPDGVSSVYGQIDPAVMARIGRDRVNPNTMEPSPFDVFDDDASPGGNGSLRQGIYDADRLLLWVAAGEPPVPENPFICFSLGEMLGFPNAAPCESPAL